MQYYWPLNQSRNQSRHQSIFYYGFGGGKTTLITDDSLREVPLRFLRHRMYYNRRPPKLNELFYVDYQRMVQVRVPWPMPNQPVCHDKIFTSAGCYYALIRAVLNEDEHAWLMSYGIKYELLRDNQDGFYFIRVRKTRHQSDEQLCAARMLLALRYGKTAQDVLDKSYDGM